MKCCSRTKRIVAVVALLLLALGGFVGYQVWYHLFREEEVHYDDVAELFKYGPGGGEKPAGLPYHIWAVLPTVFADKLPDAGSRPTPAPGTPATTSPNRGWEAFNLLFEPGHELPMGVSSKVVGFPRISNNCAFCHISSYRAAPGEPPTRVLAGTRQDFDAQRYYRFLIDCGKDPRFDAEHLMPAIEERFPDMPLTLRLAYRHAIIDRVRKGLAETGERLAWWYDIPDCGPGRWEAFNDLKYFFAEQPIDGSIGNPDIPALWNIRPRQEAGVFHWDGMNEKLHKTAFNASVGSGATPETLPKEELERLMEWWMDLPAPKYPYAIDEAKAARGKVHWDARCADCHEIGRPGAGRNIAIDEVGTDPERLNLMTQGTIDAYNAYAKRVWGWDEWQLRKTKGYNAVFLDGIWLRGPYLHNGSVPTLADLLLAPAARPKTFHRGSDLYDQRRVGFVSGGPDVDGMFLYDTSLPGNRNIGHTYGTDLPDQAKDDLLEYLKTL